MNDQELLSRISTTSTILVGKPVIRGTRLSVEHILNLMAHGATFEDVMTEYRGIQLEDIHACLLFATKMIESEMFLPLGVEGK